jgi:exosortase H (IPTLxxWG-CTERM-specific)
MDAYLYGIATQTSAVLSLFGDQSLVENPDLYQSRTGEIRAELQTLGGKPAADPSKPLTTWEIWRYRALTARAAAREAEAAYDDFIAAPWSPPADPAQRAAYLDQRLARVQPAVERAALPGGMQALDPDTANAIPQLAALLKSDPSIRDSQLPNIEQAVRTVEARVASLLERHAVEEAAQARDAGPRVSYIAHAGAARRISDLRAERAAAQADSTLDDNARQQRLAAIDTRISALQDRVAKDPKAEKDSAFTFHVVADCGAIPSMSIFLAAVLAFPAPWSRRFLGILLGIPVLYALNILRLACLGALGAWVGPGPLFDFAHHYVWQGIFIVFVVAVWLLWVEYVVRGKTSCRNAAQ